VDGSISFFLIYLSLLIFMIVLFIELNLRIRLLRIWVLILCIIFFIVNSFIHIYIILESRILPFLFLLLGYGYQVEKIQASYYLVFYSTFRTIPLLFIVVEDRVLNSSLPFIE
jgi:NADH-ubiquinone oxidoreductase chain 4